MAKKTNLVKVLAALMVGAAATGAGVASVTASAQTKSLGGVDVSSFRMEYGASVRFNADDGKNGIRFKATLSDTAYAALEKLEETDGTSVNYGVIIVPADLYSASDLTVENIFGTSKYCLEDSKECSCAKTHLASVKYEALADDKATDGVKNLRGSLVDILPSNLTREFTGIGYIEYVTKTGTNYVMAEHAFGENGEGEANIANNTRSMTFVAQKAIVAGEDNAEQTLFNDYVSPLANKEFKYTVNHYLPDSDGEYGAPVTETLYGKLNTAVTASNIAKSSLENKAEYADYATYGVANDSNASDIIYANGKTVLNTYYVARNTVLFDGSKDASYLASANANATVTTEDGYTKVVAGGDQYGLGHLRLALPNEKIEEANSANWDYLTVRMKIEAETTKTALDMFSWTVNLGSVPLNTWVDFVIPKAFLNNPLSYVINSKNGKELSKTSFDDMFLERYGENNTTRNFFYTNSLTSKVGDETMTYYIESITWGVDVVAPEISVNNIAKVYEGTFNPILTVSDNIIPNTTYSSYKFGPSYSSEVYAVESDNTRTLVSAESDGTWNLTKGNYVFVVTADDANATDVIGNVSTKEVPFEVIEKNAQPGDITTFAIPSERSYIVNNSTSVGANISWLESYERRTGVLKFETAMVSGTTYGAYFYLNFSDDMITEIWNAYNDSTTEFTFTLSMWVDVETFSGDYATCGVSLYNNQGKIYSHNVTNATDNENQRTFKAGQWEEFSFSESEMETIFAWSKAATLSTSSNFYKQLKGTYYLFYLGWPTCAKSSGVTYYVDSISYSTTAIVAE